ncbi:c-type cytochrome [Maliponia aquimaris]|uniref:Cytochrome c n=1 Tax=Maliponia aquimaris TaxID=1673631 RepID=A0A238KI31_9RHOB|nr:c-type cytochrome [Maliponia aquimaris]SMX42495.1 Cytochrome c [Maliponia aquimaris]
MIRTTLALAALVTATACAPFWAKQEDASRAWFNPLRPAVEEAEHPGARAYADNCAHCHGASGQGDGIAAGDLPIAVPDLTALTLAHGGVFPAELVLETVHGYPGKFHRGSMPEFERQLSGPVVEWRSPKGEIIMTPKGLLDVVTYVESLQADGVSDG